MLSTTKSNSVTNGVSIGVGRYACQSILIITKMVRNHYNV
jgi:hypothetical protein